MSRSHPRLGRQMSQLEKLVRTILILTSLAALYYAATWGPIQTAQSRAETTDGAQIVEVADGITVTPAQDWLIEPLVRTVVSVPVLPDLRSWAVYFGTHTGTLLRSPDRLLTIEIDSRGPGSAQDAGSLLGDQAAVFADKGAAAPALRTETLASGATLWHLDTASELLAVVDRDGDLVTVVAKRTDGGPIDPYRPAIGQLLETIR